MHESVRVHEYRATMTVTEGKEISDDIPTVGSYTIHTG